MSDWQDIDIERFWKTGEKEPYDFYSPYSIPDKVRFSSFGHRGFIDFFYELTPDEVEGDVVSLYKGDVLLLLGRNSTRILGIRHLHMTKARLVESLRTNTDYHPKSNFKLIAEIVSYY